MTTLSAQLQDFLDAAHEASSVDCYIIDKVRLYKAVVAFEQSIGIACVNCGKPECPREHTEDGDPLCGPNAVTEEEIA